MGGFVRGLCPGFFWGDFVLISRNGKIEKEEFSSLQTLHLKTMNELSDVDCKMGQESETNSSIVYWKR